MLLITLLIAALLATGVYFLGPSLRSAALPRPAGLLFLGAAGLAGVTCLVYNYWPSQNSYSFVPSLTPESRSAMPTVPPLFLSALGLSVLVAAVYFLSALRGIAGFPAYLADAIVVGCGVAAIWMEPTVLITSVGTFRPDSSLALPLFLAWPITLLAIWAMARLSASLNRLPNLSAGYLGLVSLTLLLLLGPSDSGTSFFPWSTTAVLGGAGLATFALTLGKPNFNMGWSATLAAGFALGLSCVLGFAGSTWPALLILAILTLGLPLLDVTFFQARASMRGEKVDWSQKRVRLHEALATRGVSTAKISAIYFFMGLWSCLVTYLAIQWLFSSPITWRFVPGLLGVVILAALGIVVFISLTRVLMRRVPGEIIPESLEAFGVKLSPVSMEEALDKIEGFIQSGKPHHVVTSDANSILTSKVDEEYARIMRAAALITPDGFGVIWGVRLLNLPIYERVTGVDMVTGICQRAATKGYSIYILGSAPGVAATAANNLAQKYPGLTVAGTHHGFWRKDGKEAGLTTEEADAKMADEIRAIKPDVLFVAMGIPSQEKFIAAQMERLNVPVSLGVGGSFDVYSGKFNRAPQHIQRMGLEWMYRVYVDPSRWKRMGYVPRFMMLAIKTWLMGPPASSDGKKDLY